MPTPGADELDPVQVEEVVARPAGRRLEHQEVPVRPGVGDREGLAGVGRGVGRAGDGHAREQRAAVRRVDRVPPDLDRAGVATGVPPEVRNVIALMLSRLNGPLSSIQSPALRPPRWSPPPTSVVAAVFVPDWLTANSTSCFFCRIWCCVDRGQGRDAARPAEVGVRRADHAEHVAAVRDVVGVRRQDARAAGRRRLGVAVRVVPEHERHLDLGRSRSARPPDR